MHLVVLSETLPRLGKDLLNISGILPLSSTFPGRRCQAGKPAPRGAGKRGRFAVRGHTGRCCWPSSRWTRLCRGPCAHRGVNDKLQRCLGSAGSRSQGRPSTLSPAFFLQGVSHCPCEVSGARIRSHIPGAKATRAQRGSWGHQGSAVTCPAV